MFLTFVTITAMAQRVVLTKYRMNAIACRISSEEFNTSVAFLCLKNYLMVLTPLTSMPPEMI